MCGGAVYHFDRHRGHRCEEAFGSREPASRSTDEPLVRCSGQSPRLRMKNGLGGLTVVTDLHGRLIYKYARQPPAANLVNRLALKHVTPEAYIHMNPMA